MIFNKDCCLKKDDTAEGESFTIAKVLRKNPHTDIAVALFDVSPEYVRQIASEHGITLMD